jgi:hypothetical protein
MKGAEVRYLPMPDLPDGSKCGLDDWFVSGGTVSSLEAHIVDALPGSVMDWDTRIPLDAVTGPPFPVDALPGPIGELVAAALEWEGWPWERARFLAIRAASGPAPLPVASKPP